MDLLVSLSTIYQTSIDDLRETMDKVNSLITAKLKNKPCLASECKAENLEHIDTGLSQHQQSLALVICFFLKVGMFVRRWFDLF